MARKKVILPEETIIAGLREHNQMAFEALYDMYSPALLGIIHRIVRDQVLAEDLLQEAFIKIWNTFAGYDVSKGKLFTWIAGIARNLSIDKIRSKEYRNSIKNQDIENNVNTIDVASHTHYRPEHLGIKALLGNLKPEQQQIFDLVYYQGYTHTEVSEQLGVPLGTVKTRLRMGVLELRKFFN